MKDFWKIFVEQRIYNDLQQSTNNDRTRSLLD